MKIRCQYNSGKIFNDYPQKPAGVNEDTEYGLLKIGKEYIVMGILIGEGILEYLIDDGGIISAFPNQLFEVTDNKLPSNWYFRAFTKEDEIYPYQEAIWGYHELCFNNSHYEQLIEQEEEAVQTYFRQKIALEKYLAQ
ncbi:MAG: hypothetical protein GQ564_16405 [Bacteroidales bacterium]|nr:hypothetical protein [Bacteroidales bacterium]